MLNRVLDLLASAGWFDVVTPFEKTINLTQGACLWLLLTRSGDCDTYVKFTDCISLAQEAQRCAAAYDCYPTLAPRFVGYLHQGGLDVLVFSGGIGENDAATRLAVCQRLVYLGLGIDTALNARANGCGVCKISLPASRVEKP